MKERLRMIGILTGLALVSGLLLAWTNSITRDPIEQARRQELTAALARVMPPGDNDVLADTVVVTEAGKTWTFYVARKNGAYAGAAFVGTADGYGGPIEVLVGLQDNDTINKVEIVLADRETPGLGSKIKDPEFLRTRFANRSAMDSAWCHVKKDGGEIAEITGATISSRAVAKAVKDGLEVFAKHAAQIHAAGSQTKSETTK